MQKYFDTVLSFGGRPVPGVTVTVVQSPSGVPAVLYSDNGVTPIVGNSVVTDASGLFFFYATDGRYNITFSGAGVTSQTLTDVLLEDPAILTNIVGGTIDGTVIGGTTPALGGFTGVQLSTTTPEADEVGRFTWNDVDGTANLRLKGGNVTLQVGQENLTRIVNKTGTDFTELQAVYVVGAQGQRLSAALAIATAESTSSRTFAIVTEPIANNAEGFVTASGLVRDINTSAFAEGDALWLSASVAGGVTNVRPTAPNHGVLLGWCVISNPSNGSMFVHVQNGFELGELHDVLITAPADGQMLRYEASTGLWQNTGAIVLSDAGNVGVGTASPLYQLDIQGTGGSPVAFTRFINANASTSLSMQHSRGSTVGSNVIVQSGDLLGTVSFTGADGTTYLQGASIIAGVDAAPTAAISMPGYLSFRTSAVGSISATERLRIDSAGNVGVGVTPSAWGASFKAVDINSYSAIASTASQVAVATNVLFDTAWKYKTNAAAALYQQAAGSHAWSTAAFGIAGDPAFFYPAMTLNANGDLGIGVSPIAFTLGSTLQVNGTSVLWGDGSATYLGNNFYYAAGWKYRTSAAAHHYYISPIDGHTFLSASAGVAGAALTWTNVLQVDKGKTLALEGATSAAGTGIAFPTTQLASSNANTLDDYEEGTFTPTIQGGTTAGVGTYTTQIGRYQKVGNRVDVSISLVWTAHTGTGSSQIAGMPFTSANITNLLWPMSTGYQSLTVAQNHVFAGISNNTSVMFLNEVATNAAAAGVPMDTSASLWINGTYEVAN